MKKNLKMIVIICALAVSTLGFIGPSQEHQHTNQDRSHYEERQEMYRDRWYWQMPRRVMDELRIKPGMIVADVGAGIGYFTLKIAQRLGETGKVFASDIDSEALSFLDERRKEAGLNNITIIQGREDNPLIPEASVDLVLIVNAIQLVKEKKVFLDNLRSSLKKDGKVVFVQWDAEKMDSETPGWSPEDREKYLLGTMLKMIYNAGYEVIQIKNFLPMQLIYICQPST
jgi:ubiquinone/menaquinone biosynthesis C-methylase UbiE